ncbi:MAG: nucleotidyltransferase domain-containing protein [Candidatus Bathyarchaeia archaeon]
MSTKMLKLPEKLRKTLEKTVKEMAANETVSGIGLFGSWSRGDATLSSDVDLLILSNEPLEDEYVERISVGDLFLDLNFVPKHLIQGPIHPKLDQKLYEAQILYDREWTLTNTKLSMAKFYGSPERIDIRTQTHVIESDVYLSRATSAHAKGDYLSAQLFAIVAMENILRVPLEIALEPFSNSRFLEKLEIVAERLGMQEIFDDYLKTAKLNEVSAMEAEEKLKLFKTVWDETSLLVKRKLQTLKNVHFKVKTSINYYFNAAFMQGTILRANSMINSEKFAETAHYLTSISLNLIENYAWLKATAERQRVDYTSLIRSIEKLERGNPKHYQNIIKLLNLTDTANLSKEETTQTIGKVRRNILKIRRERKHLIKTYISKS